MFNETNGSQVEQVDLDKLDDEEAPCVTLRNMSIEDVCPKESEEPKTVEGFLLGYDSNTRAYRVFNKSTGLVEVSCDIVFDETNGSQVEQVDLDEIGDEEAPCVALRNMSIGDVCPKESEEPPHAQDQPWLSSRAS